MDWSRALFQVIEIRSFSSIWYWMAVAVVWSSVSHYVLGVPYDMIQRARRNGGQAEQDLHDMVRICVNRLLHISQLAGMILLGFACFILSSLAVMGFWYGAELAQAVFLIAFPLSLVGAMSLVSARDIAAKDPLGEALYSALNKHRFWTQTIGMVAIFITAMYGMYQNLDVVRGL